MATVDVFVGASDLDIELGSMGPKGDPATTGIVVFIPDRQRVPNQRFLRFHCKGTIFVDATLSVVDAATAALADTVITVLIDGVAKGACTFLAGTTVAILSLAFDRVLPDQVLELIGPATPDFTLADISVNFISH